MKCSIKSLLIVWAAIMCLAAVPPVWADDYTVDGEIVEANRDLSTIVVETDDLVQVTIIGFPFHMLEMELDEEIDPLDSDADGITIEVGDCVTVVYEKKVLPSSGEVVNKFEELVEYCEGCYTDACNGGEPEPEPDAKGKMNRPNHPGDGKPGNGPKFEHKKPDNNNKNR